MDLWHEAWKTHPGLPGALLYPGSSEHLDAALWANDWTPTKRRAHHEVFSRQLTFQMYLIMFGKTLSYFSCLSWCGLYRLSSCRQPQTRCSSVTLRELVWCLVSGEGHSSREGTRPGRAATLGLGAHRSSSSGFM